MTRISSCLFVAALAATGCNSGPETADDTADDTVTDVPDDSTDAPLDEWDEALAERETDYSAALRIAALRLTGDLPTMTEINAVAAPTDPAAKQAAYETLVADFLARPTFGRQMVRFWRDTFKMGESVALDTAPVFAAELAATNGSYMDLLTRGANNCPTYNGTEMTFAAGECMNGGPKVGVLSNPGMNAHFYGNFAFRRVKWVQETFDCTKFPVELGNPEQDVGGASPYTGAWPLDSIAGLDNGGRVNFKDVTSAMCVNCHQTLNHIAPLFGNYDLAGVYQANISVPTPTGDNDLALRSDYLPDGEGTAWRFGVAAADLTALGTVMAQDPDVARCAVARVWNWGMGKTDIVDTLMDVPVETMQAQVDGFVASGHKLRDLIYTVFTADDFVKF